MKQTPTQLLSQIAIYAFAALIVSMIFHSDVLRRLTVDTPQKIGMPLLGSRTDLGDNYHYYSYAKHGLSTCFSGEAMGSASNSVSCTYPGALLVENALYRVAAGLSPSPRYEPALTLILNTALLTFSLLICLSSVLGRHFWLGSSLGISAFLLFIVDNFARSLYFGSLYTSFADIYNIEPSVIRIMNPTLFWALGLFTLGALVHAIRSASVMSMLGCAICALLLGTASIAVAGTLLAGLGLYLVIEWLATRRLCRPALLCAVLLMIGVASTMWMFKIYWASDMGKAFKHGQFVGLHVSMSFLWLLLPVVWGRISPIGGASDRLLKAVLIASMLVGALCDSFELGARLWLRGAVIFALVCCAGWLWCLIADYLFPIVARALHGGRFSHAMRRTFSLALCIAAPSCLLLALLVYRPWHPDTWRGYMERDKFEALTWLDTRVTRGEVVASPDIDDSHVIPFYTKADVLVPLYGLAPISQDEGLRRYFHLLSLLANGNNYISRLLSTEEKDIGTYNRFLVGAVKAPYDYNEYQKVAFYGFLIYYSYNSRFTGIFTKEKERQEFVALMRDLEKAGAERKYSFTYLLLRNDEPLRRPDQFVAVFRNRSYTIFRPKAAVG
jgi:hypothetical protein